MWYLSEQLVGLVFFDDSVSLTKKRDILKASAEQEGSEDPPCRVTVDTREAAFTNKTIADYVATGSMKLLQLMSIDMTTRIQPTWMPLTASEPFESCRFCDTQNL